MSDFSEEYKTQPVTQADLQSGRIRIPSLTTTLTRNLLPSGKSTISIVLRGHHMTCSWNPRDGEHRSGVIQVGAKLRDLVHPQERLTVSVNNAGELLIN